MSVGELRPDAPPPKASPAALPFWCCPGGCPAMHPHQVPPGRARKQEKVAEGGLSCAVVGKVAVCGWPSGGLLCPIPLMVWAHVATSGTVAVVLWRSLALGQAKLRCWARWHSGHTAVSVRLG